MPQPILQIRVELQEIEPLIWRRLQVPGDYTFWDLHVAIQSAFAWTDTHLHEFRPCGQRDGTPRFGLPLDDFDDNPPLPDWEHRVADILTRANPRLEYEYDFGDGWLHLVTLEEALDDEGVAQTVNFGTKDTPEAIAAWMEKRNPVFKGR